MKESRKRLFQQFAEMAEEGKFGDAIKTARQEYNQLLAGIATFLKCVSDAYEAKEGINEDLYRMRDLFTQLIIVAYRDATRVNQQVASDMGDGHRKISNLT